MNGPGCREPRLTDDGVRSTKISLPTASFPLSPSAGISWAEQCGSSGGALGTPSTARTQSPRAISRQTGDAGVSVSSGCHNRGPRTGQLKHQSMFSQFWRLDVQGQGPEGWFLLRPLSLGCKGPLSLWVLTWPFLCACREGGRQRHGQRDRERGLGSLPLLRGALVLLD